MSKSDKPEKHSKDEKSDKSEKQEKHSKSEKPEKQSDSESDEFLFIFESEGMFYSKLEHIKQSEGMKVIIHPIYYSGYNNTMTSEDITWVKDRWVSSSSDGSWLETLKEFPDYIYEIDSKDVVILHDDFYYHCDGCLLETLVEPLMKISVTQ